MAAIHEIMFNMQALYSLLLGIYAAYLWSQDKGLSGNFWGSVVVYVLLNVVVLIVGVVLALSGFTIQSGERIGIYVLYMLFLIVIMPGLFSMLRGRDDKGAALYFAVLAIFNASVSFSMAQRGLATWIEMSV